VSVIYSDGLPVRRQFPVQVLTTWQRPDREWNPRPRDLKSNVASLNLTNECTKSRNSVFVAQCAWCNDIGCACITQVTVRYDDIHRVYSPLRRLASVDTLRSYCACATELRTSGCFAAERSPPAAGAAQLSSLLTNFVRRRVTAESYMRDECDVVFRPLGVVLPHDFLSRAPTRPAELSSLLTGLADRKRPAREQQQGVTRAAIEVTRGCDEMSGRLLRTGGGGEGFTLSVSNSSAGVVNGDATATFAASRNTKALSLPQTTDKTITDV